MGYVQIDGSTDQRDCRDAYSNAKLSSQPRIADAGMSSGRWRKKRKALAKQTKQAWATWSLIAAQTSKIAETPASPSNGPPHQSSILIST